MGYANLNVKEGGDLSPYLQPENIDPKWLKAIGYKSPAMVVEKERAAKDKVGTGGEVRNW